ncbi:MAG: PTS sugar transporter subunit IIA [bacterium]
MFETTGKSKEYESSTVIGSGLAIPHIIGEGSNIAKILLVRAKAGIIFPRDEVVRIVFVLICSVDKRIFHLKVLASIAQIIQNPEFIKKWLAAGSKEELKNIVLLAETGKG